MIIVVGISFNLIIIRVDQGKTIETMYGTRHELAPAGTTRRSLDTLRIRPLMRVETDLSTGVDSSPGGRILSQYDVEMAEVKSSESHSRVHVVAVPACTPETGIAS